MPERGEVPQGTALSEFVDAATAYVQEKRHWLKREFGTDDYGVQGAVIVGSVAAGTERPDSDVDVYVIADDESDVDDFVDGVEQKIERVVDLIGVIHLSRGEVFRSEDWSNLLEEKGYYSTESHHLQL